MSVHGSGVRGCMQVDSAMLLLNLRTTLRQTARWLLCRLLNAAIISDVDHASALLLLEAFYAPDVLRSFRTDEIESNEKPRRDPSVWPYHPNLSKRKSDRISSLFEYQIRTRRLVNRWSTRLLS